MRHGPFGSPRQAILATALAFFWFHPLFLNSFAAPLPGNPPPVPVVGTTPQDTATLAVASPHAKGSPAIDSPAPQAPPQTGAMTEIRALFAEYLRLHAAKKMDEWSDKMFLPEAVCFRTAGDGKVAVYPIADLARSIAEEAKALDEQHEIFDDVRIEVYGHAAVYATTWTLFHNGKVARKGRAFFSLAKKDGAWKIATLVWYRD